MTQRHPSESHVLEPFLRTQAWDRKSFNQTKSLLSVLVLTLLSVVTGFEGTVSFNFSAALNFIKLLSSWACICVSNMYV